MTHEEYKQQLTAWAGLTEKRRSSLSWGRPRATAFWAAANGFAPC